MPVNNIEIIVGTYEEFLLGYRVKRKESKEYTLTQSFANHSHRASVRCVAVCGKFLASGGADESIYIYDLETRKESGMLMHHNGTVNCLTFSPTGSHLLSGGEDGTLAVCRTGNWQLEKVWGSAHKNCGVTSLNIHPSGKLLLSLGSDGTLRSWNLVKGRKAYVTNLGKEARWPVSVLWSPDGNRYAVIPGLNRVDVYLLETAAVESSVKTDSRICCSCFLAHDVLCLGLENGQVMLYSLGNGNDKPFLQLQAHDERVKAMAVTVLSEDNSTWLATGSSGGKLKLWKYKNRKLKEKCSESTGCRITCVVIPDPNNERACEKVKTEPVQKSESDSDEKVPSSTKVAAMKRPLEIGEVITEVDTNTRKRKRRRKKRKSEISSELGDISFCSNGKINVDTDLREQNITKQEQSNLKNTSGQWSVE